MKLQKTDIVPKHSLGHLVDDGYEATVYLMEDGNYLCVYWVAGYNPKDYPRRENSIVGFVTQTPDEWNSLPHTFSAPSCIIKSHQCKSMKSGLVELGYQIEPPGPKPSRYQRFIDIMQE